MQPEAGIDKPQVEQYRKTKERKRDCASVFRVIIYTKCVLSRMVSAQEGQKGVYESRAGVTARILARRAIPKHGARSKDRHGAAPGCLHLCV
jgi:hypothetical protein